ncbi:MAG TPA: MerR family transcriptional regulator [Trebonia sp.]|jgi:DNA-binding transcriptional MerR regulator|nr:MerR family transcriptional regulator [Trebonia sp.]
MAVDEMTWRIGEVATATGLTVRALHHYDQIGLVVPSARTSGGHRLYTDADLAVLYQVTTLRQLGVPLDQIAVLLAGRADVRQVIDEQLAQVDRQIRMAGRLREQLLAARETGAGADGARFAEIIKLAGDLTGYLDPEQIDAIRRRMSDLGVVAEHAVGVEIPKLYGEALTEMRSGTPPGDPAVRRIVGRLDELSELLRGGRDTGVSTAVRALWADRGRRQPPGQGGADWGELVVYLDAARAARLVTGPVTRPATWQAPEEAR